MKNKIILAALAALALIGCQPIDNAKLTLSKSKVEFDNDGGKTTVEITSNTTWTVTKDAQTWYSVTPESGKDNGTLTITVEKYTEITGRSAVLTIAYGEGKKTTLTLVQELPLQKSDKNTVTALATGSKNVLVQSPVTSDYKVEIPASVTWVKVAGTNKDVINFEFEPNETENDRTADVTIKSTKDDKVLKTLKLVQKWSNLTKGDLLIEEVFFTGNFVEGKKGNDSSLGDQYFKLTNNSDRKIYADGVMILFAEINSTKTATGATIDYTELPGHIGVSDVYVIPGKGTEVPIEKGGSLIIALSAQDFHKDNPHGFDLSKADFEFYDVSSSDKIKDTDNPDVKNLDVWVKESKTFTTLHNRGYKSYAIACHPASVTSEKFLADYKWAGDDIKSMSFKGKVYKQKLSAYKVPENWVLDAVNLSRQELLYKLPWGPKLDAGWTYCGKTDKDKIVGKSVIRNKKNGKLVDTDNSTNDFTPEATPSMKK